MIRILFLVCLLSGAVWAQPARYALGNAVIHTAMEEPFLGFVVVNGDKIEEVGKGQAPLEAIDLEGAHLYPGLIDADSALGLVEIESLRATRDHQEVGMLNPNLVARLGFRAESDTVSVARSQGVLYSGVNPRGSLIAGQGSVMRLWGWTWEDMTVVPAWALAVDWPSLRVSVSETDETKKKNALKKIGEDLFFLEDAFEEARFYGEDGSVKDVKWSALKPYAKSEAPVLLRVSGKDQIQSVLDWSQEAGVKPVLVAGRDVHLFAKELAKRNIPVIYYSLFNQNPEELQRYDLHYRVPKLLTDAGVKVALSPNGLAFDVREIRDLAGRARAFGLSDLEALQTITLNPAEILGVAKQVGSIEVGKQASFVLCQGDILEVAPEVIKAWGDGREIDLEDRQKALYRKYRERVRSE